MRAVRCDACGAKAMIAAAKCPSCGHLFELRDGFGELLPLSYCSSCESYYPESVGSCRWCGTKPDRPPIGPRVWHGAGVAVIAVIAVVAVIRNGAPTDTSRIRSTPAAKPAPAVPAPSASAPLDSDTTTARLVVEATDSLLRTTPVADTAVRDGVRDSVPRATVAIAAVPKPEVSPRTSSATKAASAASSQGRRASRWVRSTTRHWVVVRAGASKSSRIVASIGPNSRVELGESRGDWRRIRAKGISGWVEPRRSFELAAAR